MTTTDLPPTNLGPDDVDLAEPEATPVEGVDPRMRDRWVEARRAEGRRRLRVIVALVALGSLVGIGYLVANSPLLGTDTVTVRGAQRTTPAAVRAAARIGQGEPLLFLDTAAIERRVQAVPGIDRAVVTTELPNTVVLTVTERQPVGWIRTTGTAPIALVDGSGRVVARAETPPVELPEVLGAGPVVALGHTMDLPAPFRGLAALPAAIRLQARRLVVANDGAILKMRGSPPTVGRLQLGPMHDIARKGAAATAVIDDLVARGQRVSWLDVTVPEAPVTR